MGRFFVVVCARAALTACKDKSKSADLPPAQEWSASSGNLPPAQQPANPHGGTMSPHGEGDVDPSNPHAGVDMNNPHAGGSPDVSQMGLTGPDPNRKIDPTHHLKGIIRV